MHPAHTPLEGRPQNLSCPVGLFHGDLGGAGETAPRTLLWTLSLMYRGTDQIPTIGLNLIVMDI